MKISSLSIIFLILISSISSAQNQKELNWWNPALNSFYTIDGQGWPGKTENTFDRLPAYAKDKVRKPVWELSHNSAGLLIRFLSNSNKIVVRYKVSGNLAMPHMPATGVSGVDLYGKDKNGNWHWYRGDKPNGKDIITHFRNLNGDKKAEVKEYRLYLPLYNTVEQLEIATVKGSLFEPLKTRAEKPIVVYGTSIAQGACASRPGMAWTAILERKMDRPVINLGFSGNGRLEPELIDLIAEIDAKIYILDCLPNLLPGKKYSPDEIYKRIIHSVKQLKENRPGVPILLADHASDHPGLNEISHRAFADLKSSGMTGIYLLTHNDTGLTSDSFVDGTHPSDYGMVSYAQAYEKKLRRILNEPIGTIPTEIPVTQHRDGYNWSNRHREILIMNREAPPEVCLFGNSITHYWGGEPVSKVVYGGNTWEKYFGKIKIRNFGFGWDRIENVLWRVYHDELDGFKAKHILVMIGTNNLSINATDEEITEGIRFLINAIKTRQPDAELTLLGIYP
ncbi:MAG: acetylhydrolase, partial [Chlorobi bacterium]|nr:acetylhydrolase [Chlorobiota bacterium]